MYKAPNFEKRILANGRAMLYRADSLELLHAGLLPPWDALVSDPPYGIGFQHGGGGNGLPVKSKTDKIIGDDKPFDPAPWLRAAGADDADNYRAKPVMFWGADHYKTRLPEGGRFICWDKSCGKGPAASFADAEFAWTNRRNPRCIVRHVWMGCARADDGFDGKKNRHHVSQKPVSVMAWCLEHARIGLDAWVLDPYMGSGSTGVACLLTGRRFVGVEIDPAHFEVACQRIEAAWAKAGEIDPAIQADCTGACP